MDRQLIHTITGFERTGTAMHALALAAAETAAKHEHFPLPPWGYSLAALAIFFGLFLVTWSFRSVGTKHH